MEPKEQPIPDARACARLLFDTIPGLMRGIFGTVRKNHPEEDSLLMSQVRTLEILRHAPRSLSELAALHHVTPSTMSRTVDVLVRRDWVAREQVPTDRRQIVLTLTEEGQNTLAASRQHTYEVATQLLDQLNDDERARLHDGLLVLHDLVQRIQDEQGMCRADDRRPTTDDRRPTTDKVTR